MDFYKFKFLTYRMVLKVSVLIMQNSVAIGETVAEIWQFFYFFFKMAALPHLRFVVCMFGPPTKSIWWCLSVQTFVGIDEVISMLCKF